MHILFISHSNGFHGAERVMLHHINAHIERGDQVSVLIPSQTKEHDLVQHLPISKITLLYLPYKTSGVSWLRTMLVRIYNFLSVLRMIYWCRKHQVDSLYSNTSITILGAQITSLYHIPHQWHFHEPVDELFGWKKSLMPMYRKWVNLRNTVIIFISNHQREEWENELQTSISYTVQYNPISPIQRVKTAPHKGVRIGYLGNFEQRKNIPFLIQVYKRIHALFPETELWLYGALDKNQVDKMRHIIGEVRNDIQVELAVTDVARFYSEIDIFVLPSLKETMPLVSLEAGSCGVCTIQTDSSFLNELLEDGKDCLFVSPTDENKWVAAISRCMDKTYRQQIAQNGLNKLKQLCE